MHKTPGIVRMVDLVGRPRKPEGEKYRTPGISLRPPPGLMDEVNALRGEGESLTAFIVAGMWREVRYRRRRHAQKESPPTPPDTPTQE